MNKTMPEIESYFNACVRFWELTGLSKGAATVRAIWWDCAEVWNADKSWTPEKVEFINRYRQYEPYGLIPEEKCVEAGNA